MRDSSSAERWHRLRLLLTIIVAIALALYFERRKIRQFLDARRAPKPTTPSMQPEPVDNRTDADRMAAWKATVAAVDHEALREALTILADGNTDTVDRAIAAAEECWVTTRPQNVPATAVDRTERWWNRAIDVLEESESIIGFDWKDYNEFTQGLFIAGLPIPKEVADTPPPEGRPIEAKLRNFDTALQPYGYRFILMTTPYDDLRGKVISKDAIPRMGELSDRLRVDTGGPPPDLPKADRFQ
jgi:hypothetical protein